MAPLKRKTEKKAKQIKRLPQNVIESYLPFSNFDAMFWKMAESAITSSISWGLVTVSMLNCAQFVPSKSLLQQTLADF